MIIQHKGINTFLVRIGSENGQWRLLNLLKVLLQVSDSGKHYTGSFIPEIKSGEWVSERWTKRRMMVIMSSAVVQQVSLQYWIQVTILNFLAIFIKGGLVNRNQMTVSAQRKKLRVSSSQL